MHSLIHPIRLVLAAGALALLAACGGGGGGSDDGGGNDAEAPRVAITEANAPNVAAQAIAAGSAGFIGDSLGATGVQVDADARPAALTTAWRTAARVLRSARPAAVVVGVTFSETLVCSRGGSVTISGEIAIEQRFSAGDSLKLTFRSCVEEGARIDGELEMTLTEVNADASLLAATATARALRATVLGITERADGSLRLRVDETSSTSSRIEINATRLDFDRIVGSTVRATRTLLDYDYLGITTLASGRISETVSFVATGNFRILGEVSFRVATRQPVITEDGAEHPASGVLEVFGANGSAVSVNVIAGGVRLDIDTNGDGSIDRVVTRSWDELDATL